MSRSIWKGPILDISIWKKIKKVTNNYEIRDSNNTKSNKHILKIWNRRSLITPELIGTKCEIYTGNKWVNLNINEEQIGHHFGEFAHSKKIAVYKRKAKAKAKKSR